MRQAILVNERDNVVTALLPLREGVVVEIEGARGGPSRSIALLEDIAFGHKFAVEEIEKGTPVVKYGETIGMPTRSIHPGEWVHVHNIESTRGRGDLDETRT